MKKTLYFVLPLFAVFLAFMLYPKTGLYKSSDGTVTFFSEAPLENIDATSNKIVSVLNGSTNEVAFNVAISSFQFKKAKMQQDFNNDFMESSKYPDASYKGTINEKIDWTEDGNHRITSTGVLTIHGVSRERTDTATVIVKEGIIDLKSNFYVRVADHGIKIPKLLYRNIAEVVSVKLAMKYEQAAEPQLSSD